LNTWEYQIKDLAYSIGDLIRRNTRVYFNTMESSFAKPFSGEERQAKGEQYLFAKDGHKP